MNSDTYTVNQTYHITNDRINPSWREKLLELQQMEFDSIV